MKGYLLDTNVIFRWQSGHATILTKIASLPVNAPLRVSVITLGEIRFGYAKNPATDQNKRDEFERWLKETFPNPLPLTQDTTQYYGDIRAQLFRQYPPCGRKENHPEMCYDKITAKELAIDENDLWVASQALEHNLVLVSNDRMKRIRTAAGNVLDIEDWENSL
jgi:tRNA(fMet)-specific endonuclease VapC